MPPKALPHRHCQQAVHFLKCSRMFNLPARQRLSSYLNLSGINTQTFDSN